MGPGPRTGCLPPAWTTIRAVSWRVPAVATICARPGPMARTAPDAESTLATAESVLDQLIGCPLRTSPWTSRTSATKSAVVPNCNGVAGRWTMVIDAGLLLSPVAPSGRAPDLMPESLLETGSPAADSRGAAAVSVRGAGSDCGRRPPTSHRPAAIIAAPPAPITQVGRERRRCVSGEGRDSGTVSHGSD